MKYSFQSLTKLSSIGISTLSFTLCFLVFIVLTGCGGGGGGGGGGSTTPVVTTVSITGTLQDTTTGIPLQNRTVTVQGTSLSGLSNTQGVFVINGVTGTSIALVVVDSNGQSDGTTGTINLASLTGNPVDIGVIKLDVSTNVPPPPL